MTHIKCSFRLFITAALHHVARKSRAAALKGSCRLQTTKSVYSLSNGPDQSVGFASTTLSSRLLSLEPDLRSWCLAQWSFGPDLFRQSEDAEESLIRFLFRGYFGISCHSRFK